MKAGVLTISEMWYFLGVALPKGELLPVAAAAAALDVTVVHPLQDATRARAAVEPGYALQRSTRILDPGNSRESQLHFFSLDHEK